MAAFQATMTSLDVEALFALGQVEGEFSPKDLPMKISSSSFISPPPGLDAFVAPSQAAPEAAVMPQQLESNVSEITLVKPPGGKLGISVVPVSVSNLSGIFVQALEPGSAIDAHNRTSSEDETVSAGDCIVKVNNIVLNAVRMMEELSKGDEIKVTLLRQVHLKDHTVKFPTVSDECVPKELHDVLAEVASTVAPSSPSICSVSNDESFFSDQWEFSPLMQRKGSSSLSSEGSDCTPTPPPGLSEVPMAPEGLAKDAVAHTSPKAKAGGRSEGKAKSPVSKPTTLMLRQLPYSLTREMLAQLLDSAGFAGLYDFIYMPVNIQTKKSFTYAFVNMVTNAAAEACREKLNSWSSNGHGCVASWADSEQGLAANIARFRNSPVMHERVDDDCKPAIYKDGVRVPFPPPTRALKAPPARKRISSAEDPAAWLGHPQYIPRVGDSTLMHHMGMCPDSSDYGDMFMKSTMSIASLASESTSFGSDYLAGAYDNLPLLD